MRVIAVDGGDDKKYVNPHEENACGDDFRRHSLYAS